MPDLEYRRHARREEIRKSKLSPNCKRGIKITMALSNPFEVALNFETVMSSHFEARFVKLGNNPAHNCLNVGSHARTGRHFCCVVSPPRPVPLSWMT